MLSKEEQAARRKLRAAIYYQANKEKIKKRVSTYHKVNQDLHKANNAAWYQANKENVKARTSAYQRLKNTGWTLEQYQDAFAKQNGLCAICGKHPGPRGLQADHDHVTGKTRQLLCMGCNTGLGKFNDDPELLEVALSYLKRHLDF